MSVNRLNALLSITMNSGCSVHLITKNTISRWELPSEPFHPAFQYLSETHKSDYLRAYLMYHYGGGYTDIKPTIKDWSEAFKKLRKSRLYGLGYPEIGPHGVAPVGGEQEKILKENYIKLIGLCAFIFRPKTEFTLEWISKTHQLLDEKMPQLIENPAKHPQDQLGIRFQSGEISKYPLKWTELLGNIFHPIAYKYASMLLQEEIAPIFKNYR